MSDVKPQQLKSLSSMVSDVQMVLSTDTVDAKAASKGPVELFWTALSSGQRTLTSSPSTG